MLVAFLKSVLKVLPSLLLALSVPFVFWSGEEIPTGVGVVERFPAGVGVEEGFSVEAVLVAVIVV